ncbi:MAG: hypothetical protein K0S77_3634 [Pseudomonas sp.]|jgi:hypothetical protein|nr:hypothetical protein [Pseudomonas sp.]
MLRAISCTHSNEEGTLVVGDRQLLGSNRQVMLLM